MLGFGFGFGIGLGLAKRLLLLVTPRLQPCTLLGVDLALGEIDLMRVLSSQ